MTVSLLSLQAGWVSLEFEAAEGRLVRAVIEELHGPPEQGWSGIFRSYTFGGCSFIYYDEWDEHCLLSNCDAGSAILKTIAAECQKRLGNPA